jgi:hypothetical protein
MKTLVLLKVAELAAIVTVGDVYFGTISMLPAPACTTSLKSRSIDEEIGNPYVVVASCGGSWSAIVSVGAATSATTVVNFIDVPLIPVKCPRASLA